MTKRLHTKIEYAKPHRVDEEGRGPVIILDRVSPLGIEPDYCVHGKTQCRGCGHWCWLGDKSYEMVLAGVDPLCMVCAEKIANEHPETFADIHKVGNIGDHRRADGPHE